MCAALMLPPPLPPHVRRALRLVLAASVGLAIGLACARLPEEFRPLCRAVARLASALLGGG